jgi:hypothetical protein
VHRPPSQTRIRPVLLATLAACALTASTVSGVDARTRQATHARAGSVLTSFQLRVSGRPADGTTFWASYGPLAGSWGVVRLLPRGNGLYSAWTLLPANGRTTFAYLAAQGVIQIRHGPEPGGVPTTIALLGPTTAASVSHTTVRWQAPAG